jgi:hypothetical protein
VPRPAVRKKELLFLLFRKTELVKARPPGVHHHVPGRGHRARGLAALALLQPGLQLLILSTESELAAMLILHRTLLLFGDFRSSAQLFAHGAEIAVEDLLIRAGVWELRRPLGKSVPFAAEAGELLPVGGAKGGGGRLVSPRGSAARGGGAGAVWTRERRRWLGCIRCSSGGGYTRSGRGC